MLITVAICSAARRGDLKRAVNSLKLVPNLSGEIVIIDNGYDPPLREDEFANDLAEIKNWTLRLLRLPNPMGPNSARNYLAQQAKGKYLFSLDDDAYIIDGRGLERAFELLEQDENIGAIAFRQCRPDGSLDPGQGQASFRDVDCYVPAYGAYAAIIRRELYVRLGGYREICWATGEEPEFCKRLYGAGFFVVAVPENAVAHCPSPVGRDELRRLRFGIRNRIYDSILNEPLVLIAPSIVRLLIRFRKLCADTQLHHKVPTKGSFTWLAAELRRDIWTLLRSRRAIPISRVRSYLATSSNPDYHSPKSDVTV